MDPTQPVVRVMRLYKPEMPLLKSVIPPLNDVNDGIQFAINPSLVLPDSFGDIFVGEGFSAYVSIVGTENTLYDVRLSVKLQTTSETIDLVDSQTIGSFASSLSLNEYLDLIVRHTLNESGWHTMKVYVHYTLSRQSEQKMIKKFYRFNVIEPLNITSVVRCVKDKVFIQFDLVNKCKHILVLENVSNFIINFLLAIRMTLMHFMFSFSRRNSFLMKIQIKLWLFKIQIYQKLHY